jgi:hypothetical protein
LNGGASGSEFGFEEDCIVDEVQKGVGKFLVFTREGPLDPLGYAGHLVEHSDHDARLCGRQARVFRHVQIAEDRVLFGVILILLFQQPPGVPAEFLVQDY